MQMTKKVKNFDFNSRTHMDCDADGKYNVNYSVQNDELYKANKDAVKADRDEFEALVETLTE